MTEGEERKGFKGTELSKMPQEGPVALLKKALRSNSEE